MIGSRVYSARVPLLLAFCKAHHAPPQPRNESVFRCGDTTVTVNCGASRAGGLCFVAMLLGLFNFRSSALTAYAHGMVLVAGPCARHFSSLLSNATCCPLVCLIAFLTKQDAARDGPCAHGQALHFIIFPCLILKW